MVGRKVGAACTLLLAVTSANASTTQLFGVADLAVEYAKGSTGSAFRMRDGEQAASRFGIQVIEDLGRGTRATALMEAGVSMDTGMEVFGSGTLFGRQAYVGLGSESWGEVRLGRQYTPSFYALVRVDPFSLNAAVSPFGLINSVASQGTGQVAFGARFNNAVQYFSPKFGGVSFGAAVAPGEVPGSPRSGLNFGANLTYASKSLYAFYAYQGMHNPLTATPVATRLTSTHLAGGTVRTGPVEWGLAAGYASSTFANTKSARHLGLTANWDMTGRDVLKAAIVKRFVRDGNQPFALALGWDHAMSKRTALYARALFFHNSPGGSISLNQIPIDPGSGDSGRSVSVGMRHRF